jgi:hypothetical protein
MNVGYQDCDTKISVLWENVTEVLHLPVQSKVVELYEKLYL